MVKMYDIDGTLGCTEIMAIGDVHGDFKTLMNRLKGYSFSENNAIIVCGDSGFGFHKLAAYENEMKKLNNILIENNNCVLFIRGNHDDPSYFENETINLERVKTIPDYSVVKVNSTYALCVGGGISIDRKWRLQQEIIMNIHNPHKESHKKIYWENEQIVYDEGKLDEIVKEKIPINAVCTHSAPSFCDPKDKTNIEAWLIQDPQLEEDLKEERGNMDKLFHYCKRHFRVKKWAYGHFHKPTEGNGFETIEGVRFKLMRMMNDRDTPFDYWFLNDEEVKKVKSGGGSIIVRAEDNRIGAFHA